MWSSDECQTVVLKRGSHDHPWRGACLLEIAGTLPGGPWSDRPASVGPVLARLGRLVNDLTSDSARYQLIGMAAWLVGSSIEPRDDVDAAIAALAGQAALGRADPRAADRLARRLALVSTGSAARRRRRIGRLLDDSAHVLAHTPDGDQLLGDLLNAALNLSRGFEGLPPLPDAVLRQQPNPTTLPVRVELRSPDGAESTYFHCTALWTRWPEPLRHAWIERCAELHRGPQGALSLT
jgi:hypothetical protein